MAWTLPTALFFVGVLLLLVIMSVAEIRWPTHRRRGLLPIVTTRGDRLFISLLVAALIHLAWLATTDATVVIASVLALAAAAGIMARG
jgi:predicted small integral membrane protein